jgi:predicted phage terminase large subunit-like protein
MDRLALRELDAALRTRFDIFLMMVHHTVNPERPYLHNWHVDAMVHQAEAVIGGDVKRLIVNVPPRNLKTLTFNVALSAFILGHNPHKRIFCISYGERLAVDHAAQFRAVVESDWYRRVFPRMQIKRVVDHDFFTTARGFRKWTSISGALTGMGGDIFIVDDCLKPEDALSQTKREAVNSWFGGTLLSRLDSKQNGAIIVLMQRLHQDDLSGYLLRETTGWTHLELPAIALVPQDISIGGGRIHHRQVNEVLHPQFEGKAELDQQRDSMGPMQFSAQYLQRPIPVDGALMDAAWFRYYDDLPERNAESFILQSWDTAAKDGLANSYSTCTTWLVHEKSYYLVDILRMKLKFPALRGMAVELSKKYKPRYILIEDASTGPALADELRREHAYGIEVIKPEHDKQVRLFTQQGKFSSGRVWFPRQAPWIRTFLDEILSFPDSKYSDQVDSLSQALAFKGGYDPGAISGFFESLTGSYAARYAMATGTRLF